MLRSRVLVLGPLLLMFMGVPAYAEPSTALQLALTDRAAVGLGVTEQHRCSRGFEPSKPAVEVRSSEAGYMVTIRGHAPLVQAFSTHPQLRRDDGARVTLLLETEKSSPAPDPWQQGCDYSVTVQIGWRHLAKGDTLSVIADQALVAAARVP